MNFKIFIVGFSVFCICLAVFLSYILPPGYLDAFEIPRQELTPEEQFYDFIDGKNFSEDANFEQLKLEYVQNKEITDRLDKIIRLLQKISA